MLAALYEKIMAIRNAAYSRGVFEVHDLGARTISVGNITTGGTGKTPLVAHIASLLLNRGEIVCVLTRGYGRKNASERVLVADGHEILADAATAGDEPLELAAKFAGRLIVISDADRMSAGEWAKRKFGVTAFILDDGFQHRKVKRDLDIVCVSTDEPFGRNAVLPAGRLRERLNGLERADVIIVMNESDLVHQVLKDDLRRLAPEASIFEAQKEIKSITDLRNELVMNGLDGQKLFGFCGLGNPGSFYALLHAEDADLTGFQEFADHHCYTWDDVAELETAAVTKSANALVTTAKDAVKLKDLRFTMPCFVVEIDLRIDNPEGLASLI